MTPTRPCRTTLGSKCQAVKHPPVDRFRLALILAGIQHWAEFCISFDLIDKSGKPSISYGTLEDRS